MMAFTSSQLFFILLALIGVELALLVYGCLLLRKQVGNSRGNGAGGVDPLLEMLEEQRQRQLRIARAAASLKGKTPGAELCERLKNYSERNSEFVKGLQQSDDDAALARYAADCAVESEELLVALSKALAGAGGVDPAPAAIAPAAEEDAGELEQLREALAEKEEALEELQKQLAEFQEETAVETPPAASEEPSEELQELRERNEALDRQLAQWRGLPRKAQEAQVGGRLESEMELLEGRLEELLGRLTGKVLDPGAQKAIREEIDMLRAESLLLVALQSMDQPAGPAAGAEQEQLRGQVEELRMQLAQLEERAAALANAQNEVAERDAQLKKLNVALQEAAQKNEALRGQIGNLDMQLLQVEERKSALADLDHDLAAKDRELQGLRKELLEADNRADNFKQANEKLKQQVIYDEEQRMLPREEREAQRKGGLEDAQAQRRIAELEAEVQGLKEASRQSSGASAAPAAIDYDRDAKVKVANITDSKLRDELTLAVRENARLQEASADQDQELRQLRGEMEMMAEEFQRLLTENQ